MLALKDSFQDVKGEAIENQLAQEVVFDTSIVAANETLDVSPDSAFERQEYFDNAHLDPNFGVYDNDVIAMELGNTGNEATALDIRDRAATSGGELGNVNGSIEYAIDNLFDGESGSDPSRERDLSDYSQVADLQNSEALQNWSVDEQLDLAPPMEEELVMPEISYALEEEDPNIAVQAIYIELADKGVNPAEIDNAMRAGNDFDVLQALSDVAKNNGLDDIAAYGNEVQLAFANTGVPEAIQNVVPEITEQKPAFAMNDPQYDVQNPALSTMRMG